MNTRHSRLEEINQEILTNGFRQLPPEQQGVRYQEALDLCTSLGLDRAQHRYHELIQRLTTGWDEEIHMQHRGIQKTAYTVKVQLEEGQEPRTLEVEGYSPEGATYTALEQLKVTTAKLVHTMTGGGQHVWFHDARRGNYHQLHYSKKDN